MPDPSLLLLMSCFSCIQTPSETTQDPSSVCYADQQVDRDRAVTSEFQNCISEPEVLTELTTSNVSSLQFGDQGQRVIQLQRYLEQLGYSPRAIDGIFGTQTQLAVIQFQQDNNLPADGVVGVDSWTHIFQQSDRLNSQAPAIPDTPPPQEDNPKDEVAEQTPAKEALSEAENESQELQSASASGLIALSDSSPATETPSNRFQRTYIHPPTPHFYYWIAGGWLIIYLGGWGFIIKDLVKELRGYPMPSSSKQPQKRSTTHASPAAQSSTKSDARKAPSDTTADRAKPPAPVTPKTSPVSATQPVNPENVDASTPPSSENAASPLPAAQLLTVAQADQGKVVALDKLFAGMRQPTFTAVPGQLKTEKLKTAGQPETGQLERVTTNRVMTGSSARSGLPSHLVASRHPSQAEAKPATQLATQPAVKAKAKLKSQSESKTINQADPETVVAKFPPGPEKAESWSYSLVEDESHLFVLRGNELRVLNHRLNPDHFNQRHTVTIRQTSATGAFVDKSYKIRLQKKFSFSFKFPQPQLSV